MVFKDRIKRTSEFYVNWKRVGGTRPPDQKLNLPAAACFSQKLRKLFAAVNVLLIDTHDDVARMQPGQRSRRARSHRSQQNAEMFLEQLSQLLFVPSVREEGCSRREFHRFTHN